MSKSISKMECSSAASDNDSDETYRESENNENDDSSSNEEENDGPILPGGHRFDKKLVCIRYPGNVINPDKAIETLGGLSEISATVDAKNKRLELRFRPDDGYCNPACGDRHQTVGFLLRVRVKKSRKEQVEKLNSNNSDNVTKEKSSSTEDKVHSSHKNENQNNVNSSECESASESLSKNNDEKDSTDRNKPPTFDREKYENLSKDEDYTLPKLKVLGRVDTEFRFTSMCDFQYLPITKNKENPLIDECIYDKIYPVGLPPLSWMENDVPYFLPPAAFSRMDTIQQYAPKQETSTSQHDVIGKTRKRRSGFSNYINFTTPYVPTNPPKGIEMALKVKFLQSTHVEKMRKMFEQRPIWSKVALRYLTRFSNEQLKVLLPAVAYYFMTGPWRITWVKLGYDPRKDPEARKYQTLDYRMKGMDGLLSNITCKRNYSEYVMRNRNTPNSKSKAVVLMPNSDLKPQKKNTVMNENVYIYRTGIIPPSRQMFYQYCDVYVAEIQDMLDKLVSPPPGTVCHEKYGWLPSNFDDLCREIISKYVRLELRKSMNIPENHPTSLPRKRNLAPSDQFSKAKSKKKNKQEKPVVVPPVLQIPILDEQDPVESGDEWDDTTEEVQAEFSEDENDT